MAGIRKILTSRKVLITVTALTAVLVLLRIMTGRRVKEPVDKTLFRIATEVNNHAPRFIDSTCRLDYMNLPGNGMVQYYYTLVHDLRERIDTARFRTMAEQAFIKKLKEEPAMKFFTDNKITFGIRYVDKNNEDVCQLLITAGDYQEKLK